MTDLITSLIRTLTPMLVGAVVAWLLTLGVQVDTATQTSAVVALTGLLQAVYYTAVTLLERKWPVFGKLLGKSGAPTYK